MTTATGARAESLGVVGVRWPVVPLKYQLKYIEGPGIMAADFVTEGVPLLRISSVAGRYVTLDGCDYLEPALVASKWSHFRVEACDLLISGSASTGLCAEVTEETVGAVPYTGLIIIRPRDGFNRDFARWFLLSDLFAKQVAVLQAGSAIQHFGPSHLGMMFCPVPSPTQQRAIARFLDEEVGLIDAAVSVKKHVIDLLAEKRKAIIATAVTRGLDPKVKLRDSGVPWLAELPAHWSLVPLRYLLHLGPRNGISPQQAGADGVLSFSISAVRDGHVTIEGNEKFVELDRSVASSYYLRSGDILLVRGNGNLSLVGTCGLLEMAPAECTYPDILMLMRVGERIIAELLVAAINAPYVRQQIESLAQTTNGTYKLSGEDVRTLRIALPPLTEQRAIVDHIARETAKLDAVRAATERTIVLLKERRSALIAAAVTGQFDLGAAA